MSSRTARIVRTSMLAALVVAATGAVGLVSIGLSQALGEPWGTVGGLAFLVMVGALAPLMLAFYELGGRAPLRLAQLAQTLGWVAVFMFIGVQLILLTFGAGLDIDASNSGAFMAGAAALGYIGLWVAGANLLAGPWLSAIRWLGVLAGLAAVVFAFGLLSAGSDGQLTSVGWLGTLGLGAAWALLMARLLRRLTAPRSG